SKSTAWNEFGTNIASAVICLAKKQKFNFSKLIFDGMLRNLDSNSNSSLKDSPDAGFKPSREEEKKDAEYSKNKDSEVPKDNVVDKYIVYGCANDLNMPNLEEIVYSDDDEDNDA
ncbi:hypothetical protein Tco_0062334, partial [Tanacetum coccineum]